MYYDFSCPQHPPAFRYGRRHNNADLWAKSGAWLVIVTAAPYRSKCLSVPLSFATTVDPVKPVVCALSRIASSSGFPVSFTNLLCESASDRDLALKDRVKAPRG